MDLYSVTLSLAILCAVAAVAAVLWVRLRGSRGRARPVSKLLIVAALLGNALSFALHRVLDHGPHSSTPLDWEDFFRQHPAFAVALGLTLLAMMLLPGAPKEP